MMSHLRSTTNQQINTAINHLSKIATQWEYENLCSSCGIAMNAAVGLWLSDEGRELGVGAGNSGTNWGAVCGGNSNSAGLPSQQVSE